MRRLVHRKGSSCPGFPSLNRGASPPCRRQPEPLLQGLWRHRDVILRQWPLLPLPTQAPRYGLPLPIVRQDGPNGSQFSYNVDASTVGPGPDACAAALITLWQRSEWMRSPCHACGGDMLAVAFGGILTVGGMYGICADCFATGARFIGGFPFALRLTHELLADTPWTLPWQPVRFTLGGRARALRAVLAELGVEGLDSDVLLPNRAVPITEARSVVRRSRRNRIRDDQGAGPAARRRHR